MEKFSELNKKSKRSKRIFEQDQISTMATDAMTTSEEKPETTEESPEAKNQAEEQPVVGQEGSEVVKLFSKIFESREIAHVYHLQAKGEHTHSTHIALQTYYEEVIDELDTLIEVYQGQNGIVDGYETIDPSQTGTKEVLAYFEETTEFIKNAKKAISEEDTWVHSILDNIMVLLYQLLYRLKFTK